MAEEVVNTVTLRVRMQQAVEAEARKVVAALKSINAAGGNALTGLVTGTVGQLAGIGGIYAVIESLKKAAELARASETNSAKLSIALDGNVTRYKEMQSVIENISKSGVYSQADLSGAAQQLIERGVPTDQISRSLQVIVDTASGLRIPLQEAAEQVAQTFGGAYPKSLSRAVPGLKELTVEQLKAGEALDLLSAKFRGQDAAFASTAPGKELASLRDIEQAWTDIGKAMLPIERELLPRIAQQFKAIDDIAQVPGSVPSPGKYLGEGLLDWLAQHDRSIKDLTGGHLQDDEQNARYKQVAEAYEKAQRKYLSEQAGNAINDAKNVTDEISEIKLKGLDETNKRENELNAKAAEDEFRQRQISLQRYIQLLDETSAKERGDAASRLATLQNQLLTAHGTTGELVNSQAELMLLQNGGPGDARRKEAIDQRSIDIDKSLSNELALRKSIAEATQNIRDLDRSRADAQVKAVDEAIKNLPASAETGAKSVQNGTETASQLINNIQDQSAQITVAMNSAFADLDGLVARKIFSPEDATALKVRLTAAFLDANQKAKSAADSVTPIVGDLQAIGDEARKSATSGLSGALTDWELHAKSASQAFGELAQSIIKGVLEVANQRLVSGIANTLLGNADSSGKSTSDGLAQLGIRALIGAVGGAFGGGSGSMGGYGTGSVDSAGNASLAADYGEVAQYASGGYTGSGHPSKVAGIVHKGEYVVPADIVKRLGVPTLDAISSRRAMNQISARMFPDRSPRGTAAALASIQANGGMSVGGVSGQQIASMLGRVSDALDNAADAHLRPTPAILVGDRETARQLFNTNGAPAELAEMMKRNPSTVGPAIQRLQR